MSPPPPPTPSPVFVVSQACRYGRQRDKVMSVLEMMVEDGVLPSGKSYSSALQVRRLLIEPSVWSATSCDAHGG